MLSKDFKGFKQVTFERYESLPAESKKGYIWFVRDFNEQGEYLRASIYVRTRLYADSNDILNALMEIGGDDVE
jgi:hypothetical protein